MVPSPSLVLVLLGVLLFPAVFVRSQSSCNSIPLGGGIHFTCTNTELSEIRDGSVLGNDLPTDVTSMVLGNIQDNVIESGVFELYTRLTSLTLSGSSSNVTFDRGAFRGLPSLKRLDIDNVKVPLFSAGVFKGFNGTRGDLNLMLRSGVPILLNPDLENLFNGVRFLTFSGTVHCDCRILWLRPILDRFGYNMNSVRCSSSVAGLSGVDIMTANASVLNSTCPDICGTRLNDCHDDANCTNQSRSTFRCTCNNGFEGNGLNCTDIDECLLNTTCPVKSTCMNTVGGYLCLCEEQRTLNGSECVCSGNMVESASGDCVCPLGLSLVNSSGLCECTGEHTVYNATAGICECTENRTGNGTECVCMSGFVEDVDSGECVCVPGLVYSSSEGTCICEAVHSVYNRSTDLCECDSNSTNVGGVCVCKEGFSESGVSGSCVCLAGLVYQVQSGTCSCPGENMVFNESSGVCACSRNRTLNGNGCVCREGFREENGVCVCLAGLKFSSEAEICSCPGENMVYNVTSGACMCGGNRTFNGTGCVCGEGFAEDTNTGTCVCRIGLEYSEDSGTCVCLGEHMIYNASSGECVCDRNRTMNGSECVCRQGFEMDENDECVCSAGLEYSSEAEICACPGENMVYNRSSGVCVCSGNRTLNGSECVCRERFESREDGVCMCLSGLVYSSQEETCLCPSPNMEYTISTGSCECSGNRTFNSTHCVCQESFEENELTGVCVCLTGLEYLPATNSCGCGDPLMHYNDREGRCECDGNRTLNREDCVCKSNLVEGEDDEGCVCVGGMRYSPSAGLCLSECVPPNRLNNVSGLCECPAGEDGCPSLLESLLNLLRENATSEALEAVVLHTLSEVQSGNVESNDTDNLIDLVTSSTTQLLRLSSTDVERAGTIAQAILNVTSSLLNSDSASLLRESNNVSRHIGDLLTVVHNLGAALVPVADQTPSGVVELTSGNIVLRITSLSSSSTNSWVNVSSSSVAEGEDTISFLVLPQNIANLSNCSSAVISGVVSGLHLILPSYSNFSLSTETAQKDRILSGLCPSRDLPADPTSSLNSVVLISSLYSECSTNTSYLDPPVRISLHHEQSNFLQPHCVADSSEQFGAGLQWSEEGCRVVSTSATRTECACSHLTSFAILMHPSQVVESNVVLSIATKVGLCVSIICLLVTVIVLFGVKVKSELIKVHRQLALSLLLTEVVFLIGVDRQAVPSPDGLCTTFAALLHYLLLVTFTWMLIEGVHILVYLIVVFFSSKIYILYYFLGWGIPLFIVAISLVSRFCDYGSSTYCWISSDVAIWAFRAPVILVLATNTVILVVTIVIIVKEKKKREKDISVVVESLRTTAVLFPVLGLCWVVGLFIFGDNATYVSIIEWIFFVMVILQGVLVFLFNCVFKKEVRTAVLKKLGFEKRKLNKNQGTTTIRSSTGSLARTLKGKISSSAKFYTQKRKESTTSTCSTTPLQLKGYELKETSIGDTLTTLNETQNES